MGVHNFAFWVVLSSKLLFPDYPFACRIKMGRKRFRVRLSKVVSFLSKFSNNTVSLIARSCLFTFIKSSMHLLFISSPQSEPVKKSQLLPIKSLERTYIYIILEKLQLDLWKQFTCMDVKWGGKSFSLTPMFNATIKHACDACYGVSYM